MLQTLFTWGQGGKSSNGAFPPALRGLHHPVPQLLKGRWHVWEPAFSVLPNYWDILTCLLGRDGQKTGGLSRLLGPQLPSLPQPEPKTIKWMELGACFLALWVSSSSSPEGHSLDPVCLPPGLCTPKKLTSAYVPSGLPRAGDSLSVDD